MKMRERQLMKIASPDEPEKMGGKWRVQKTVQIFDE
jgi:hypothetical protein